jgi:hypothetical protein
MLGDSQDDGASAQKQEDNKQIPIQNGTHKGELVAEGGWPTFTVAAEGRPNYGWVFLYCPSLFTHLIHHLGHLLCKPASCLSK